MIKRNINLKKLNTFGIDVFCDYFVEINSISDFLNLIKVIIDTSLSLSYKPILTLSFELLWNCFGIALLK